MTHDTKPTDVRAAAEIVRKARAAAQAEYDMLPAKDRRLSTWERMVRLFNTQENARG